MLMQEQTIEIVIEALQKIIGKEVGMSGKKFDWEKNSKVKMIDMS